MASARSKGTGGKEQKPAASVSVSPRISALWTPQPGPQVNAITADWCPILLYGGAKYGGKTDFLLGDYLQDLETYREHWQGIIFRRALTEFTQIKIRANELFPQIGGLWKESKNEWHFPRYGRKVGDSTVHPILRFRYLEDLREVSLYEGHSYPFMGFDELGDWEDETSFFRLLTANRYATAPIPTKRARATCNPGGRGHQWIKKYFIDPAPLGYTPIFDDKLQKFRMFIPARLHDNKIGLMNDPGYEHQLNRAGSPALVRALKEGDWNIVAGAFFVTFTQRNIIPIFKIPEHWTRFVAMDWGACGDGDPFSIGWWAVADGNEHDGLPMYFRRGDLIRYREWYGSDLPKVTVDDVANGIKLRENEHENIRYRVAGGDINQKRGTGPSVGELFQKYGLSFQAADQRRAEGWIAMNQGLRGRDGRPTTYVCANCIDSIEIIPTIQHDMRDPEDIEETGDHIPDEWRYAHMSRSWASDPPAPKTPRIKTSVTIDDLFEQNGLYEP